MANDIETPDFSGDDLGHHKEVQLARAERKAYEQLVQDSLLVLTHKLGIAPAGHKNLKHFLMFKSLQPSLSSSYTTTHPTAPLHVSLVAYESSFPTGKYSNSGTDEYLFGYLPLRQTYPATYMCKETLHEKITDLLLKTDVDFDHSKKFSRKFHVVTEDRHRLLSLMQTKSLDHLTAFPDMEVELSGNGCLFRHSKKPISQEAAEGFAELALALLSTFG